MFPVGSSGYGGALERDIESCNKYRAACEDGEVTEDGFKVVTEPGASIIATCSYQRGLRRIGLALSARGGCGGAVVVGAVVAGVGDGPARRRR